MLEGIKGICTKPISRKIHKLFKRKKQEREQYCRTETTVGMKEERRCRRKRKVEEKEGGAEGRRKAQEKEE